MSNSDNIIAKEESLCDTCAWVGDNCNGHVSDGKCPDYAKRAEERPSVCFKLTMYGDCKWRGIYLLWKNCCASDEYKLSFTDYTYEDDADLSYKKCIVFDHFKDLYGYPLFDRINVSPIKEMTLQKGEFLAMCEFVFNHYDTMRMKSKKVHLFDNETCDIIYWLYLYSKESQNVE